jgi:hypothetical protein
VPPVVTITSTPICFPSVLQTWDVWSANSLVGTSSIAWILGTLTFIFSNVGMTKAAVFPVPCAKSDFSWRFLASWSKAVRSLLSQGYLALPCCLAFSNQQHEVV